MSIYEYTHENKKRTTWDYLLEEAILWKTLTIEDAAAIHKDDWLLDLGLVVGDLYIGDDTA